MTAYDGHLERRARDLTRVYTLPDRGTPAEQAFTALCAYQTLESLPELVRTAGRPLVTFRCAVKGCGTVVAAVWNTPAGPLFVTGHRVETWSPRDRASMPRPADTEDIRRHWTPRVALPGDSLAEMVPTPCPGCRSLRPLAPADVGHFTVVALGGAPLVHRV